MARRIGVIKVALGIEGVGTIIGLPDASEWSISPKDAVHVRERIQIRTLAGKRLSTYIKRITVLHGMENPGRTCFYPS